MEEGLLRQGAKRSHGSAGFLLAEERKPSLHAGGEAPQPAGPAQEDLGGTCTFVHCSLSDTEVEATDSSTSSSFPTKYEKCLKVRGGGGTVQGCKAYAIPSRGPSVILSQHRPLTTEYCLGVTPEVKNKN